MVRLRFNQTAPEFGWKQTETMESSDLFKQSFAGLMHRGVQVVEFNLNAAIIEFVLNEPNISSVDP